MSHWIEEARAYVGFAAEDEARLRNFAERAELQLPGVVSRFYQSIERHAGMRRVVPEDAAFSRLHRTFTGWLDSGLTGAHDAAWYEARIRIGHRHVEVGLADRYMFMAMNTIRADLHGVARGLGEPEATHVALDRWLDLELAVMLHGYQEDSERRLIDSQRERLAAMQRLSAGLAHEVRNPLNAARLQLELLARRMKRAAVDPALLDVAALVEDEIRRLSGLLQEFLDFARPVQLSSHDHDLVAIARRVIELVAPTAESRSIALVLAEDPLVVVSCDEGKVQQVIGNLLANAIDAAKSRVEVEVRHEGEGGVIVVHDDGAGIPDAVLPHIFEPFVSTKPHGTGMGLAITHSLVALHGGSVVAHNRAGAELTVTLPRRPPPIEAVA